MPRYLVKRTFPTGLSLPATAAGAEVCLSVVRENARLGVTWIHSYVADDLGTTFCVYDGPDPDSIRRAAAGNALPVDEITRVSVLDPYFYQGVGATPVAVPAAQRGAS